MWIDRGECARALLVGLGVLLTAAPALAQAYTAAEGSGLLVDRPDDAGRADAPEPLELPFGFRYYGESWTSIRISPHGWLRPGGDPAAALSLDSGTGLPDGAIAPLAVSIGEDAAVVYAWVDGAAPDRRLVVSWERGTGTAQAHLYEGVGRIAFAYRANAITGAATGQRAFRCGLDEPDGPRFAAPPGSETVVVEGPPASDLVFAPRTVVVSAEKGVPVTWRSVRKESVVPDGCTKRCTYLAAGRHYFQAPDREIGAGDGGSRSRLADEDREAFGGESGDPARWVRQVLDGKIILLPADGADPVRVWFRIIEYYSLDKAGMTLADHHIWNLRRMLSDAMPASGGVVEMDRFAAWKAMVSSRLTVGKLFRANQPNDYGKQYDSGRTNEYVLWTAKLKSGTRGALAPYGSPGDGWRRFDLEHDGDRVQQHEDRAGLRFVTDPGYVDGHYDYVITAEDNPYGWIAGRAVPPPPLRDEGMDTDPGRVAGPLTPR